MIVFSAAQIGEIGHAAESAYPEECCGLLVGRRVGGRIEVVTVVSSPNIAVEDSGATRRRDRFEVDPEIRLKAMREAESAGLALVGHYHSHPDHAPEPSEHDLANAFEPELVWVIVGVEKGRAGPATAHLFDADSGEFREIAVRISG